MNTRKKRDYTVRYYNSQPHSYNIASKEEEGEKNYVNIASNEEEGEKNYVNIALNYNKKQSSVNKMANQTLPYLSNSYRNKLNQYPDPNLNSILYSNRFCQTNSNNYMNKNIYDNFNGLKSRRQLNCTNRNPWKFARMPESNLKSQSFPILNRTVKILKRPNYVDPYEMENVINPSKNHFLNNSYTNFKAFNYEPMAEKNGRRRYNDNGQGRQVPKDRTNRNKVEEWLSNFETLPKKIIQGKNRLANKDNFKYQAGDNHPLILNYNNYQAKKNNYRQISNNNNNNNNGNNNNNSNNIPSNSIQNKSLRFNKTTDKSPLSNLNKPIGNKFALVTIEKMFIEDEDSDYGTYKETSLSREEDGTYVHWNITTNLANGNKENKTTCLSDKKKLANNSSSRLHKSEANIYENVINIRNKEIRDSTKQLKQCISFQDNLLKNNSEFLDNKLSIKRNSFITEKDNRFANRNNLKLENKLNSNSDKYFYKSFSYNFDDDNNIINNSKNYEVKSFILERDKLSGLFGFTLTKFSYPLKIENRLMYLPLFHKIKEGNPAERMGIVSGDYLFKINNISVASFNSTHCQSIISNIDNKVKLDVILTLV